MKVKQAMTRDVCVARPDETIRHAAMDMLKLDVGALPVTDGERLVGMITDRDIAVRAVSKGKGPDTLVTDVMTAEVQFCFDDDELDHVAQNMGNQQVRRLPVVDRQKRLVGIISLGDLAIKEDNDAGDALSHISRRGGDHNQSQAPT